MVRSLKEAEKKTKILNHNLASVSEYITDYFVCEGQIVAWNDFLAQVRIMSAVEISFHRNMERIESSPVYDKSYVEAARLC